MLYLKLLLLLSSAGLAIWSGVSEPPKKVLWVAVVLLAILVGISIAGQ